MRDTKCSPTSVTGQHKQVAQYTDVPGAAEYLGMSEAWVRAAVFRRKIPFMRVGRSVRFAYADLKAFMVQRRVEPQSV